MPCFHPLVATVDRVNLTDNGKPTVTIKRSRKGDWDKGFIEDAKLHGHEIIEVGCSQCVGCRIFRASTWAVRCLCESRMHDDNCFITLTYRPERVPTNGVQKLHFRNFIKKLRKEIYPQKVRFFACGEYGDESGLPHYHAILFGYNFSDKYPISQSSGGSQLYRSDFLEKIWIDTNRDAIRLSPLKSLKDPKGLCSPQHPKSFGFSTIGNVSFDSCCYTAKYIMKKVNGHDHDSYYGKKEDGTYEVNPEFCTMSRREGIGASWFDKFGSDAYNFDRIIVKGRHEARPSRYFDDRLALTDQNRIDIIKEDRVRRFGENEERNAWRYLRDAEKYFEKMLKEKERLAV